MSVLGHIGRGVEKELITVIVPTGIGKSLTGSFCEKPGVLSVSHHHARGVGTQRIRRGQMFFQERDVLIVLVEEEYADAIFAEIFTAARLGEPGGGIMFSEPVLRGHPMMPFEGADW